MATVAQASYDVLRAGGLTTIFGNPGSNELKFLAAMPTDFRYVLGLHEGAVISMADGFALASGEPVLVNLHAASGSGNAMGGLTNAVYSHSPLVVTAGQQVRSTIGQEVMLANVDAANWPGPWSSGQRAASRRRTCPARSSRPCTPRRRRPAARCTCRSPTTTGTRPPTRRASTCLLGAFARPGPWRPTCSPTSSKPLAAATNPAIVVGPQVDAAQANTDAVQLAEALRAPVWIAPSASRCPFPTRHPAFRGVLPAAVAGVTACLTGHDLVLVVGAPVFRYHQYEPGDYLPEGTRLIQLTADPGEAARAPVGDAVVVDVKAALAQLVGAVPAVDRAALPPLPDFPVPRTGDGFVHPDEVFALLREHAPRRRDLRRTSRPRPRTRSGRRWTSRCRAATSSPPSGGLGFGLPAAVGVQLARPDRQVIGVIGDGSANYGITALWTAARYRIPVVFVILKNGTYGALRGFADLLDTGETPGLDVPGIDFVQIAQGYGVEARAVTTGEEFVLALKSALDRPRPVLIEVATAHLQFHELT